MLDIAKILEVEKGVKVAIESHGPKGGFVKNTASDKVQHRTATDQPKDHEQSQVQKPIPPSTQAPEPASNQVSEAAPELASKTAPTASEDDNDWDTLDHDEARESEYVFI